MKKITGFILYPIALIANCIFTPLLMVYSIIKLRNFAKINDYFLQVSIAVDVLNNVKGQHLFNQIFIKTDGYKFGIEGETMSHCFSLNKDKGTLRTIGKCVSAVLISLNDPAFKK